MLRRFVMWAAVMTVAGGLAAQAPDPRPQTEAVLAQREAGTQDAAAGAAGETETLRGTVETAIRAGGTLRISLRTEEGQRPAVLIPGGVAFQGENSVSLSEIHPGDAIAVYLHEPVATDAPLIEGANVARVEID